MKHIIIIGGGPAGYEAALHGASAGAQITLIESHDIGGTCLNHGCIPTKTLVEDARFYEKVKNSDKTGIHIDNLSLDYGSVIEHKNDVIGNLRQGILAKLKKLGVKLISGYGSIVNNTTVEVTLEDNSVQTINGDCIIIATGSKPFIPSFVSNTNTNLLTSKTLLSLSSLPSCITIVGGGVIGVEFACLLNNFGVEVNLIEYAPRLLPQIDSAIGKRLKALMVKSGIQIELNAEVKSINDNKVHYTTKKGDTVLEPESILLAIGRVGNIDKNNCDTIGIDHNGRFINVNGNYETTIKNIYAIGDINGQSLLAHSAYDQGIQLMDYLIHGTPIQKKDIPGCVFSTPEAATVGFSEENAKLAGISYSVEKTLYSSSGKAMAMGETTGFIKTLVSDGGKVLGLHILGTHASDLVHYGSIAMVNGMTTKQLSAVIFAHPTLGEIFAQNMKQHNSCHNNIM